jgi:hypothetical protein
LQAIAYLMRERVDVEIAELPPEELRAPRAEKGAGAGPIAVGEMLKSHGDLDQPLQRFAAVGPRSHPVRLQQLVNLEVETCIEKNSGRAQDHAQRRIARPERPVSQRFAGPLGPLANLIGVPLPLDIIEEASGGPSRCIRRAAWSRLRRAGSAPICREAFQAIPRVSVVKRIENQLRQPIAHSTRQAHDWRA